MRTASIIGAFFAGIIVTILIMKAMAPGMMIHEKQSPYDFEKTFQTILEKTKEVGGWKVPKQYDFQKTILKHGAGDIGKVKVIELCQPHYAHGLLKEDKDKYVAVMMPCAIAIYEKSDGKTYVASMNVGMMGKIFGGGVDKAMSKVAADDKKILSFLK